MKEESIFQKISEMQADGQDFVLCTIVESSGSVPRHIGSRMLVYPDGRLEGSVGGGEVESRVIQEAQQSLLEGKPRLLRYRMVDPKRGDPGLCGGQLEVYIEPVLSKPLLLVIGGGHVGKAVIFLANWLGFRTVLSDDRPEFCNPESVPGADEYLCVPIEQLPDQLRIGRHAYIVLTTRSTKIDIDGLPALLKTPAVYIGIIGSKKRWLTTRKGLEAAGVSEEEINRIHSPIGLEIQAETPQEIAVSILAEILQVRHGGTGQSMNFERRKSAHVAGIHPGGTDRGSTSGTGGEG